MQYRTISNDQWERFPEYMTPHQQRRQEWVPILEALRRGEAVCFPYSGQKSEVKRLRQGLKHRARSYGMELECRWDDGRIAFRRKDSVTHETLDKIDLPKAKTRTVPGVRRTRHGAEMTRNTSR